MSISGRNPPLTVTRSVVIGSPISIVAAQFADVAHHQRTGPHRNVAFRVLTESDDHCDYEQHTRVGPRTIYQRFELDRSNPHHLVNTVTAGMFTDGAITFDIVPAGGATTEVTATLTAPPSPLTRLAGPMLRRVLGRSLAIALEEDQIDLESGCYPAGTDGHTEVPDDPGARSERDL